MKTTEEISDWIERFSDEIVDNIDQESIEVYRFIKNEFEKSNISENRLFQFVYRSFFRLDNAGLTKNFKTEYFKILEENRNLIVFDFEKVLTRLSSFPNVKGQKSLQFSFATKMLSTIDNNSIIYDSEVAKIFSFSRPSHKLAFLERLDRYLDQYSLIQKAYEQIIQENLLPKTINLFDQKFKDNRLSEMKKIDFIFWSGGKMRSKLKEKGDDGFLTLDEVEMVQLRIEKQNKNSLE